MKIQETKRRSHRRHISRLCLLLIVFTPVFHSLSLSFCPVPSRSFLGIRHTYRKSLKIFILFLSINENKTSKSNPKNKILHYHHYLSYCKQAIFASCIPEIIDLIGTRAKYGGTLKNEKGRRWDKQNFLTINRQLNNQQLISKYIYKNQPVYLLPQINQT